MDEKTGVPRWSEDHPWLTGAIGGASIGLVVGLIATDEDDSVAVGILTGLAFAIPLFVVAGTWGWLHKRRADSSRRSVSGLGTWRSKHRALWSIAVAGVGFLIFFLTEWLSGRPVADALVLASSVPVIVAILYLLRL
jgi:drug/metabolite transporter (DMT)-like permease